MKIHVVHESYSALYKVNLNELETAMKILGIEFSEVDAPKNEQSLIDHIIVAKERGSSTVLLFKDEIDQLNKLWKNRKKNGQL